MTYTDEPANNNFSFSQLMENSTRTLADDAVKQTTDLLLKADVPRDELADVLFNRLCALVVPKGKLDGQSAVVWYAQLQRMRGGLQKQIDAIEAGLDQGGAH